MRSLLWRAAARVLSAPRVADWLIRRAQRTPYFHITGPDGSRYMGRWWLANPYPAKSDGGGDARGWRGYLPSVRVHHICRPDNDRHLHDHPWNARTVILRGEYSEERLDDAARLVGYRRARGYTGTLLFGEYHRIVTVSPGGVWTLFITWRKRGTWGFLVDGRKVPWREYLAEPEPTNCPWCGALGVDFDESPAPSDYCGHDPALVREKNRVAPVDELVNNS